MLGVNGITHFYLIGLITLLHFGMINGVNAQSPADWWYFSDSAGVHFESGGPIAVFDGHMNAWEGCSSVSNSEGDLLFYTNGVQVWNKEHQVMPNGSGLFGDASSTQASVIAPWPGSADRFIFVTTRGCTSDQNLYSPTEFYFSYSVVDMSLEDGLGDVLSGAKNVVLFDSSAEQCAIIPHENGSDLWLIGRETFEANYFAYHLTAAGISGVTISNLGDIGACVGYLMPNHKGDMLIAPVFWPLYSLLLSFDQLTGSLSIVDTIHASAYGAHFSPNDSLFYLSDGAVVQFEVFAASVYLSGVQLSSYDATAAIAEGPDQRLYIAKVNLALAESMRYLNLIENPNIQGLGCGYVDSAIAIGVGHTGDGLPNFISRGAFKVNAIGFNGGCVGDTTFFYFNAAYVDSVNWNFGDPNSGVEDTSTSMSPFHIYTDTGLFTITLTALNGAVTDTVVKTIRIKQPPAIDLGPDLEFCLNSEDSVKLSTNGVAGDYLWNTGSMDSILWVLPEDLPLNVPQAFTLVVSNRCGADSDTVRITATLALQVDLGNDTNLCSDSLILVPAIFNENIWTRYQWSNGDSVKIIGISSTSEQQNTTTIKLTATNACGSDSDSVSITFLSQPDGVLPNDSIYCLDRPFYLLNPFSDGISYLWSDSSSGPDLRVDSSGSYWLLSFNQCDTLFDAFNVTFNGEPKVDLGNDTFLCPGAEVILRNLDKTASQNQTWLWNTTSTDSTLSVEFSGDHWIAQGSAQLDTSGLFILETTLKDCKTSDSIQLFRKGYCPERCKPGISNVITPNGDGINDVLRIDMLCKTSDLSLFIFNRWGQLVHQGSHAAHAWNGFVNGEPSTAGIYFFVLSFTDEGGIAREYRGSFSLLR